MKLLDDSEWKNLEVFVLQEMSNVKISAFQSDQEWKVILKCQFPQGKEILVFNQFQLFLLTRLQCQTYLGLSKAVLSGSASNWA